MLARSRVEGRGLRDAFIETTQRNISSRDVLCISTVSPWQRTSMFPRDPPRERNLRGGWFSGAEQVWRSIVRLANKSEIPHASSVRTPGKK
jgi:hypothetical protein